MIANAIGSLTLLGLLLMGGFVLAKGNIKHWTVWLFWACAPKLSVCSAPVSVAAIFALPFVAC